MVVVDALRRALIPPEAPVTIDPTLPVEAQQVIEEDPEEEPEEEELEDPELFSFGDIPKAIVAGTEKAGRDAYGFLDFLTGELQCWVPNPRKIDGGYQAVFKANVIDSLGIEKGKAPDYILTTGEISTVGRGASGAAPANCVCWVADCNTGRVVMYSLVFNRNAAKTS